MDSGSMSHGFHFQFKKKSPGAKITEVHSILVLVQPNGRNRLLNSAENWPKFLQCLTFTKLPNFF
jgi:hypothetical protein